MFRLSPAQLVLLSVVILFGCFGYFHSIKDPSITEPQSTPSISKVENGAGTTDDPASSASQVAMILMLVAICTTIATLYTVSQRRRTRSARADSGTLDTLPLTASEPFHVSSACLVHVPKLPAKRRNNSEHLRRSFAATLKERSRGTVWSTSPQQQQQQQPHQQPHSNDNRTQTFHTEEPAPHENSHHAIESQQQQQEEAKQEQLPSSHTSARPAECVEYANSIPPRFVKALNSETGEDVQRWDLTKAWMKEIRIESILEETQVHFKEIVKNYSHFHTSSRTGQTVFYQRPGLSNIPALSNLSPEQFVRHFVFLTEYLFRVHNQDPLATLITVYDFENVGVSDLTGNTLQLFKEVSSVYQNHYCGRCAKPICIVNASWSFRMSWGVVSPLLSAHTSSKVELLGSDYQARLCELIGEEHLPVRYGGKNTCPLGESDIDVAIRNHVEHFSGEQSVV